jgi:glycogen synthase
MNIYVFSQWQLPELAGRRRRDPTRIGEAAGRDSGNEALCRGNVGNINHYKNIDILIIIIIQIFRKSLT